MQLDRSRLLDLFDQTIVVRHLQILQGYAHDSLLGLLKNLHRNRFPSNCIETALAKRA